MPLLCNVLYLALLAMVAKWTSHRERQYYNPRTDSRQSSKARLCVYHVTAWQTRSCYCMANSNMYGKQYHATVWQTVSCYCMVNSIMLLYDKQYYVTACKQYHVTVWQTIWCYCMVNTPQWPSLDCTVHGKQTSCLKLILRQLNMRGPYVCGFAWSDATQLYDVNTMHWNGSSRTWHSHATTSNGVSTPLPWIFKTGHKNCSHSFRIAHDKSAVSLLKSGEIAVYESDRHSSSHSCFMQQRGEIAVYESHHHSSLIFIFITCFMQQRGEIVVYESHHHSPSYW